MRFYLTVQAAVISLFLSLSTKAEADSFTFTKIADNNTPIPGGTGNFTNFSAPTIDDGNVGFSANGEQVQGIYTYIGGLLNVVADTNTPIPGGTVNFNSFPDSPSIDGESVAFRGFGSQDKTSISTPQGIYTNIGGVLDLMVADNNTPIPGSKGNFFFFAGPSINDESVAFNALGDPSFDTKQSRGIYTNIGGVLNVVADTNTPVPGEPVPGATGKFIDFGVPSLDGGNVAFIGFDFKDNGSGVGQEGIYTNIEGSLKVVADTNTPIPHGTGNFRYFSQPLLDSGNVAFLGGSQGASGLYDGVYIISIPERDSYRTAAPTIDKIPHSVTRNVIHPQQNRYNIGGVLNVVADTNTPIPDGTGNFTSFDVGAVSLERKNVAFLGFGSDGQAGIYTNIGGSLSKVIDLNDSLDGQPVSFINFRSEGLSGNQIAFRAGFGNKDGVFIATLTPERSGVPEPSSGLGVLALGALGLLGVLAVAALGLGYLRKR